MAFLNPLLLFALAAAAIPVVIHLFNFRRARRIDYSSLQFLRALQRSTLQRVRVERWLLLLFRILAICCLIAAFARPVMVGGVFTGEAKVSMAVIIDNSLSMALRDAGGTYIEQAQAHAQALLASADEAYLLTTAPGPAMRGVSARAAIDGVMPDARAETAQEAIMRAAAVLQEESTYLNREVYFVGDLQRSMLTDSVRQVLREDLRTRITLVPVGGTRHENIAIEDVTVVSRVVEVGDPVEIQATLKSYRTSPTDNYLASLYLEDERVAQQSVNLAPGSRVAVPFVVTPAARGWIGGRVLAEDDAFAADNERFFTLYVPAKRRVLVVRGPRTNTKFVTLALTAQEEAVQTQTIDVVDLSRTGLDQYDVTLMIGPQQLSSGEVASLTRYVEGGGGLLLFAGDSYEGLNVLLRALGGGEISRQAATGQAGIPIAQVSEMDAEHPLFEGVFEDAERMEQPAVYRAVVYEPRSGAEQTLLSLSNGHPLLQEIRAEKGRALLFAVSPDPTWSDLPVRGLFVPLLHRSVHYLAAGESIQGDRLIAGQSRSVVLGHTPARVRVMGPTGPEITPEQRLQVGATIMELPQDYGTPGIYDVTADREIVRRMAMNLDARESYLSVAYAEEAALALASVIGAPVRVARATTQEALTEQIRKERVGVELWRLFVVLALIFMGLEMVVSTRRKTEAA